jgi:hypothetical protein
MSPRSCRALLALLALCAVAVADSDVQYACPPVCPGQIIDAATLDVQTLWPIPVVLTYKSDACYECAWPRRVAQTVGATRPVEMMIPLTCFVLRLRAPAGVPQYLFELMAFNETYTLPPSACQDARAPRSAAVRAAAVVVPRVPCHTRCELVFCGAGSAVCGGGARLVRCPDPTLTRVGDARSRHELRADRLPQRLGAELEHQVPPGTGRLVPHGHQRIGHQHPLSLPGDAVRADRERVGANRRGLRHLHCDRHRLDLHAACVPQVEGGTGVAGAAPTADPSTQRSRARARTRRPMPRLRTPLTASLAQMDLAEGDERVRVPARNPLCIRAWC